MSLLRLFLHNARVSRIQIRHILSLFHETHLQYHQIRTHLLTPVYTIHPTKLSDRSKIFPISIASSFSVFATSRKVRYMYIRFMRTSVYKCDFHINLSISSNKVILRFPFINFQRAVLFLHCSFLGT